MDSSQIGKGAWSWPCEPPGRILQLLITKLGWTRFQRIIYLDDPLQPAPLGLLVDYRNISQGVALGFNIPALWASNARLVVGLAEGKVTGLVVE